MNLLESHCESLSKVGKTNFALSLFLLIGILISYLPQHYRIIHRRSSFGLSPYYVLLGATSGTCALANILTLPTSREDIACCHEISGFACFAGLLGIAQVAVQWSCFMFILLLFLIFFPRATAPTADPAKDSSQPSFRTALAVTLTCVLHAVLVFILSVYFSLARRSHLQIWANVLGILSAVLASIQYFPQIYTTFRLKKVGSLSIPTMCIQTPGSFLWAASLAARLGKSGWSAWGVYVVTGCLQGTLLVLCIYYEILERQRESSEGSSGSAESSEDATTGRPSEETPLLRSEG